MSAKTKQRLLGHVLDSNGHLLITSAQNGHKQRLITAAIEKVTPITKKRPPRSEQAKNAEWINQSRRNLLLEFRFNLVADLSLGNLQIRTCLPTVQHQAHVAVIGDVDKLFCQNNNRE